MRSLLLSLAILLSVTFTSAQNPEKLTLKQGQQKTATGRLIVKFLAVTEDSRCPTNVNCVWAGVARIKIQLRKNGKTAEFELNTNQPEKSAAFEGSEVKLNTLTPYPKSTAPINSASYTATFTVS